MSECGESKQPATSVAAADHREAREVSRMISELNEVRMRLDAVLRKLADSTRGADSTGDSLEDLDGLRMRLNSQLDRLRYKLVSQIPEKT